MKIKIKDFLNAYPVLNQVFSVKDIDGKAAYALIKISNKIQSEHKQVSEAIGKIQVKFAETDQDGNAKVDEKGMVIWKEGKAKDYFKEYMAFTETEIEIDAWKIPFKVIEVAKLSVNEMVLIEQFMEEPTE